MISVWTDGSSGAGGGKPGGWACVIARNGDPLAARYGGSPSTTNNVMELTAAIEGMKLLGELKAAGVVEAGEACELVSDSQYTLGISSGQWSPSKNQELAAEAAELAKLHGMRLRWVRGHLFKADGTPVHPLNDRCDSLANRGKREHTDPEKLKKLDAKKYSKRKVREATS